MHNPMEMMFPVEIILILQLSISFDFESLLWRNLSIYDLPNISDRSLSNICFRGSLIKIPLVPTNSDILIYWGPTSLQMIWKDLRSSFSATEIWFLWYKFIVRDCCGDLFDWSVFLRRDSVIWVYRPFPRSHSLRATVRLYDILSCYFPGFSF